MKVWGRRIAVVVLFGALVAALLWFQGIILREEHPPARVPGAPATSASDRRAPVVLRTFPMLQVYPGFVEAIDPAAIAPRVMATVLEVAGREGDLVQAGAVVVALDDRDARAKLAQARAMLEAASAQALEAELAFDRAERLHASQAITTREWESARASRDGTQALVKRAEQGVAEAEATLAWFRLEAPFTGRVLERHADPGDLAAPGQALLTLYREDQLRLRVSVPEERAADVAAGSELVVGFDRLPPRAATLTRILPPADPRTGTVTLHLALAAAEDLRPGLLGRLQLTVGERQALVLPLSAVERIGQVERVRLVREGTAQLVTIRTGKQHEGLVEILSGLTEGEEVLLP